MATTGNNLPRKLNPQTGEWEVDQSQLTTQTEPTGGTVTNTGTNPTAPVTYNAPQIAGSNTYNPNGDFIAGGPDKTNYSANVAASGTQTATPTTTAPTTLPTELSYQGMTRDDQQKWIENYLSSHGGDPSKSPYWMGKLALGWDIPYFMSKLANDESITGDSSPSWSSATQAPMLLPMMNQAAPTASPNFGPSDSNLDPAGSWNNSENDPYTELGGGVRLASGLWVPKGSGLASGPLWQAKPNVTPTTPAPTPAAPVAAAAPSSVAPNVPISTAAPTATDVQGLVNRPENVDIQMLLNAGSTNPNAPSTTNPATFNPASAEALANSPENAAYRLGAQRAEERQRAQLAERAAANGTSESGGFENKLAGLRQARGEGEAQFVGQLAVTKMQQAREDLVNGIQFAMANQQFDKAQALQRELALMNQALQEKQLALQESTSNKQLSMQELLGRLQAATTERGQSLQASTAGNALTENARQANNNLGFNYTQLQQLGNQYLANLMLNGGG